MLGMVGVRGRAYYHSQNSHIQIYTIPPCIYVRSGIRKILKLHANLTHVEAIRRTVRAFVWSRICH